MFTAGNGEFSFGFAWDLTCPQFDWLAGCDSFPAKGLKMGTGPMFTGENGEFSYGFAWDLTCPQFDWLAGVRRFPRQRPKNGDRSNVHGGKRGVFVWIRLRSDLSPI